MPNRTGVRHPFEQWGSVVIGFLITAAVTHAAEAVDGQLVRAFDGDTISVRVDGDNLRLRLHAIDTPDQEQDLYLEAGNALRERLDNRPLQVVLVAKTHGRQAAVILVDDKDINGEMIRTGYAYAHRKYLGMSHYDKQYCALEHQARVAGLGIWSLKPQDRIAPWQLRQYYLGKRTQFTDFSDETVADCEAAIGKEDSRPGTIAFDPVPGLTPPNPDCPIKGDISFSGKRRYYTPDMRAYASIFINEDDGELWFCGVADAEDAGWERGR